MKHIILENGTILYDTLSVKDVPGLPYFFFMGRSERAKVREWVNGVKNTVNREDTAKLMFLTRVENALKIIDYDYCISTLEPSLDEDGKLFYEPGNKVALIALKDLKKVVADYYSDEKWHSELAYLEEGDLFKAYRIAMGFWSLEYVCDDSSSAGNYWDSPNAAHRIEVSGAREVGGFRDGTGNTRQIYQTETKYAISGGHSHYSGSTWAVSTVDYVYKWYTEDTRCDSIVRDSSPVITLKRHR